MDLKIDYMNVTNKEEAYQAVKGAVTPELLAKWKVKADINYDDANHEVHAKGTGFGLTVNFDEKHCEVKLDLSFLLKPLKAKILEGLEKQFTRVV